MSDRSLYKFQGGGVVGILFLLCEVQGPRFRGGKRTKPYRGTPDRDPRVHTVWSWYLSNKRMDDGGGRGPLVIRDWSIVPSGPPPSTSTSKVTEKEDATTTVSEVGDF